MLVYCTQEELEREAVEAVKVYNATPRETLKNVNPSDVYAGRLEEILLFHHCLQYSDSGWSMQTIFFKASTWALSS